MSSPLIKTKRVGREWNPELPKVFRVDPGAFAPRLPCRVSRVPRAQPCGRYDMDEATPPPVAAREPKGFPVHPARDPDALDIGALARASDGFTGAEIEQSYVDAMYAAFAAGREPGMIDIAGAIGSTVPLSRLMRDEMARLRKWAGGRCRMAASGEVPSEGRRIVA